MALNEFLTRFQQTSRPGFTKATENAWRASPESPRPGLVVHHY
jgi:hypothetical protein